MINKICLKKSNKLIVELVRLIVMLIKSYSNQEDYEEKIMLLINTFALKKL